MLPGVHMRSGNGMNRTRAGLLSGAARAFAEHGLRRSTMQSIAASAGVAKATLYNHFQTKDEVAAALLAVELADLLAEVSLQLRGIDSAAVRPLTPSSDGPTTDTPPAAEQPTAAEPTAEPALALVGAPARSGLRRGETVSLAA